MLKIILEKLLLKVGKGYVIDENIPDSLIFHFLMNRFLMLLRGLSRFRKLIFIGSRVKIYNKKNLKYGKHCTIEKGVEFDCYAKNKVRLGNQVKIGSHSKISITSHLSKLGEGLKIGDHSGFSEYCYLGCAGGVVIGNDVIIGQYVSFHSQNHNFSDKSIKIREQGVESKGIELGDNIWVGAKVTFLDGARVSSNSVVAAGAVVSGEFPPDVVIGGIPARVIKEI